MFFSHRFDDCFVHELKNSVDLILVWSPYNIFNCDVYEEIEICLNLINGVNIVSLITEVCIVKLGRNIMWSLKLVDVILSQQDYDVIDVHKMALNGAAPPRGSAAAAAANLRRRRTSGAGGAAGGTAGNMLQFYTDDAPGLKISPNVVLVMSIGFIAFVAVLHVMGKLYFVRKD
ncbi:hypothetical protein L1987_39362 [Smallanthus sonchifolius]|uniref:Uncharacterized protein n=1 Tax=Smallanthus sonchifolius TaxID=185202 RepID=A0ACB9HMZ5_9ASTR|nr:hypothetical protein L1987_39362 [Smallanthus sonchifolius]